MALLELRADSAIGPWCSVVWGKCSRSKGCDTGLSRVQGRFSPKGVACSRLRLVLGETY